MNMPGREKRLINIRGLLPKGLRKIFLSYIREEEEKRRPPREFERARPQKSGDLHRKKLQRRFQNVFIC